MSWKNLRPDDYKGSFKAGTFMVFLGTVSLSYKRQLIGLTECLAGIFTGV